ncbi:MAG: CRISPR-associated endonuclease Cas2 [Rhodoferax sp.]|nr:CRISPR-associated endonuclease Cas2 [Rhodoferax sp.]
MADEHLFVVTYDIADARRWRRVFRLMHGFGEWLQLSVFQCRLTRSRLLEMQERLGAAIDNTADHVMIIDAGPAEGVRLRVRSLGKRGFEPVERSVIVV